MFTRTLIAAAIAGAFAVPLAVQAADSPKARASGDPTVTTRGADNATVTQGSGTSGAANVTQSDMSNTPGKPGSNAPGAGASAGVSASEFARLDKDHDGFLSKDEVRLHPILRGRFDTFDKDHDGKLSQAEVSGSSRVGSADRSAESRTRISRNDRGTTGSSTSSVNPSGSTRGADNTAVTESAGTSGAANVTQSDVANTPGTPGSSSPSR